MFYLHLPMSIICMCARVHLVIVCSLASLPVLLSCASWTRWSEFT